MTISGTTTAGSGGSGVLLTDSVVAFGFAPDGLSGAPTFEFICGATGGALLADFGGSGAYVGVILSSFDTFGGDFSADYNGTLGLADTFATTPEPATITLLATGLLGTLLRRRRRRSA